MTCPKVLRWLCGTRNQKRLVRSTIDRLNEQTAASVEATQRLQRETIKTVLYPERLSKE